MNVQGKKKVKAKKKWTREGNSDKQNGSNLPVLTCAQQLPITANETKSKHSHIATMHMALQTKRKKKVELEAPRNRVKGLQWNMSKIMASQLQWAYPSHHTRKNKTQRIDCFWGNGQKFSCAFPTSVRFLFGSGTVDTHTKKKTCMRNRKKKMEKKTQPKSDLTTCLCDNLSHANNTA